MTPLKPIENLFAVEVDDNAYDFEIRKPYFYRLLYLIKGTENPLTGGEKCITVDLGKDNFEILFPTLSATEQGCAKVVERRELMGEGNGAYVNYDFEIDRIAFFLTADESLQSLLRANGLKASNYLLVKKTK